MHKDVLMLPAGVENSDPALTRIGMRYLAGRQQFIRLAAALPLMPEHMAPDVIIVDDAGDLVTHYSTGVRREKAICSCESPFLPLQQLTSLHVFEHSFLSFHCFLSVHVKNNIVGFR